MFPPSTVLESEETESARKYYQSGGDAVGTLSRMPKSRYIERQLLQGLEKHASVNNYLGAFKFVCMCESNSDRYQL